MATNPDVYLLYEYRKKNAFTVRMKITLDEAVDEALLTQAASEAMTRFPYYSVKVDLDEGENYVPNYFDGYDNNSDSNQQFKRFNVTWGVGAGFQYKRYFLRGGYDFGLINPYKNADFENENHTRGRLDQWNIKIGMYLFYSE